MSTTRRIITDQIAVPFEVRIVDRRAQYHAKVRNRGDANHPNHWVRRAFERRVETGRMIKAHLQGLFIEASKRAAIRLLQQLDWQPTLPRQDAPPRKPGSAAA